MLPHLLSPSPIKKEMTFVLHDPFFPFLGKQGHFLFPHPKALKSSFSYSSGIWRKISVHFTGPCTEPTFSLLSSFTNWDNVISRGCHDSPIPLWLFRNSEVVQHCHFSHTFPSRIGRTSSHRQKCIQWKSMFYMYLCCTHKHLTSTDRSGWAASEIPMIVLYGSTLGK